MRSLPFIGSLRTAAMALAFATVAHAQQNTPHIGYVYPAGGQRGTEFEIVVGGQFLGGVTNAVVSGDGVKATVIQHLKILTPQELNGIRNSIEKMMALEDAGKTNATKKAEAQKLRDQLTTRLHAAGIETITLGAIREYSRKNDISKKNTQPNPAISETVSLKVTIDPKAEPGDRELRLSVFAGLSNPMGFRISDIPEFRETEKSADTHEAGALVTLPAVVNGQILPGDIDRFRFAAKKGQRLVVDASARDLIPYLADAVPGWFQATMALYDAAGKEVAYDDDFRFNPDPVLFYEIPADGEYSIEIKDSIYRGREDFVYRVTIGELPFITSIYPIGGPMGVDAKVELKGWNLPTKTMTVVNQRRSPGIYPVSVRNGGHISNPMPFAVDDLPECYEKERSEQKIPLPMIINGRIAAAGETDTYLIDGRAGQQFVAEVFARRLNSPMDSRIKLLDPSGKQIAFNDDNEDRGSGLTTHHADSYLRATLPVSGTYRLQIDDTQGKAGPDYCYRLRVGPPRPDFALRVVPASVNARFGNSASINVYALRRDGLTNAITLSLKNPPEGFKVLSGASITGTQEMTKISVTMPYSPSAKTVELTIEGRSTVDGKEIVHEAVPAEDMMQAFAYRHLVPAGDLLLFCGRTSAKGDGKTGKIAEKLNQIGGLKVISTLPAKIPAGGTSIVKLNVPGYQMAEKAELGIKNGPAGITIQKFKVLDNGGEITLACDAAKAKAGDKGDLTIALYAKRSPDKPKTAQRYEITALPTIPYEIVAK